VVPDIASEALSPESIDRLRRLDLGTLPLVAGGQRGGPCVGRVGKFICIGLNYSDHAAESGMAVPAEPVVFMKATSAVSVNDLSERAFQLESTGQWVKGKSADTFGPIGPWLVTPDEVPKPQDLGE